MIIPSNFEMDKFRATADDELVAKGFCVGAQVQVIKKITVKIHSAACGRKDVVPAEVLTIKGAADGCAIIEVVKTDEKGKVMKVDWKVNSDNLQLATPTPGHGGSDPDASASTAGKGPSGVPKAMPYLADDGGQAVVVVYKWGAWQHHKTADFQTSSMQASILHNLNACIENFPQYGEDDFTIISRDGRV